MIASDVEKSLVGDVVGLVKKGPDFTRAGVYQVTINKVELAQAMFKPGHTVDIQAKVTRRDARGQDAVIWDSRNYGERLAVVGKDCPHRGLAQSAVPGGMEPGRSCLPRGLRPQERALCRTQAIHPVFLERRGRFSAEDRRFHARARSTGPTRRLIPGSITSCSTASSSATCKDRPKSPSQVADSDSDSDRPIVIK